jgi:hypothetical protein
MQSDNQSSHRRGKEQARSKHASWSLGTRGELRGGRGDNGGRGPLRDRRVAAGCAKGGADVRAEWGARRTWPRL